MKGTLAWVCVLALLAALTACQPPVVSPPLDEEAGDADAKAAALIDAVMEGRATGDFGAVETILAQDDAQGELRQALAEAGALTGPTARSLEQPVIELDSSGFITGDVLVCRGSGTLTSNLMDLVLVNGYAHAGIYQYRGGVDNCILSADVNYLTEGTGEALNYESWLDWIAKNDVITLLRPPENGISATDGNINDVALCIDNHDTVYAFLGYPGAPVGAFQPIPRGNDIYWYCSKVPARVYDLARADQDRVQVEDLDFHWENHGSGPRWWVVRQSLLYKVYVAYLKLLKPWWPLSWRAYKADLALQGVLAELVTPDELRASELLDWQYSVTPAGPIDEAQEAALLGWDTYQDPAD